MADRVIAVHPVGEQEAGGWTFSELGRAAVVGAGAELPSRQGVLPLSAGLGLVLGEPVNTPGLDPVGLLDATRSVVGMVEVAGDNGTPSLLISGLVVRPTAGLDLALTGLVIDVDGIQVATAAGAAAHGHPANAAVLGLSSRPLALPAGSILYTGRWTTLIEVRAGSHLQATFGHLGGIAVGVL